MICPICNQENNDNWLAELNGKIVENVCQDCWENECNNKWWQAMIEVDKFYQGAL